MSAILDLHPDAGHPAVRGVAELHRVLDTLEVATPLAAGDYASLLADLDRAISRLQAAKLSLVAAADKARVATLSGMSGTGAWLAKHTRSTGASAAGDVALAGALQDLPATSAALGAGQVTPAHASVIAQASRQLPAGLHADQRARVEATLVEQAKTLDPAALRKRARRALEAVATRAEVDAHEDQLLREEERLARAKTRLTLHDNRDGTTTGHFTVPTLAAHILRKTVQQMTSPRRSRLGATVAQAGPTDEVTDWAHRYGLAFVELLEHLPTDQLHGKVAATVVVTLDYTQLTHDLAAAGIDTGHDLSAAQARRLACGAGLLPAVLNGASLPLDLGRTQRLHSEAQRVALATRHRSCVADGCDRPYAWCELHHRQPWSRGGETNLKDADPLCAFHHQRIHDPAYLHRRQPTGAVTFHRRT